MSKILKNVDKQPIIHYIVDMELEVCSCSKGTIGAACKHQAAVAKTFNIASVNIAPIHSKAHACSMQSLQLGMH